MMHFMVPTNFKHVLSGDIHTPSTQKQNRRLFLPGSRWFRMQSCQERVTPRVAAEGAGRLIAAV
jgi:hypothetical protein